MTYRCLSQQVFEIGRFSIIPIRFEDRHEIMRWRNEQIYHLRQSKPLTVQDQEDYFSKVVLKLYDKEFPEQILFSFFEDSNFIGYGGLVHINWVDKNAEISFIIDTSIESTRFYELWTVYLKLIEKVSFLDLKFHKIYTYAFDIRPNLYSPLVNSGYHEEARLVEHCFYNCKYLDVVIHSKFNKDC